MRQSILVVVLLTAACIGPGEGEIEIEQSSEPIINGLPATADISVVALINRFSGLHTCSGTLVAPRVVLTAAHCLPPYLDPAFGVLEMTDLGIYFGDTVGGSDPVVGVETGKANLLWDLSSVPNDIGILYLEGEAPVPSMPMNDERIDTAGVLGTEVRAVGYGTTGPDLFDNGTRLQGKLLLDHADPTNMFSNAFPGSICPGDSGGALLGVVGGVEKLIGVASRGNCEDISIHERVDVHIDDFIIPFIDDPFAPACDADGRCASGCAAPDPDCPCAEDGLCDEACRDIATDVDCSATCTELDGVCGAECAFADLDCLCVDDGVCNEEACIDIDPDCTDSGGCGCQGGGGPSRGGGLVVLLFTLALGMRRRRVLHP